MADDDEEYDGNIYTRWFETIFEEETLYLALNMIECAKNKRFMKNFHKAWATVGGFP